LGGNVEQDGQGRTMDKPRSHAPLTSGRALRLTLGGDLVVGSRMALLRAKLLPLKGIDESQVTIERAVERG
jgi:hypothetical protein